MTYIRNAWYVSAWAHEIKPEQPLGVRILNEPIVVWRNAAGELTAFEDRCIHRLAPLSLGRCEGERLRCMYHGLLYDREGRVVEIPGQNKIPASLRVRTYPVVERHGWIWVWMGTPAADQGLIPPVAGMDHPDYLFGHGQLDYAAEARLINDNLLDLSHVTFLHAKSLQPSEAWAQERWNVTEHERSIRSERWFRSEGAKGALDTETLVDRYYCYDFYVHGAMLLTFRTHPAGIADALNGQPPDLSEPADEFASHAITPLTDKTARYFYILGKRRQGTETAFDTAPINKAFAEDKTMIEAQQRIIDATPNWRFMPTGADRGVVLFNRLVEKLALAESAQVRQSTPTGRQGT